MNEDVIKKVYAKFQISTESSLYKNIIEPKASARTLSEFVYDILDIYNSDLQIKELIDSKLEDRNPINQLKEQVLRVNSEHQKTMMSASILSSLIDFKGTGVFGEEHEETATTSTDIFENDGVIENLRMLLPEPVRQEIQKNIEKRVLALESKVASIMSNLPKNATSPSLLSLNANSPTSKINNLVDNLESIYSVDTTVNNLSNSINSNTTTRNIREGLIDSQAESGIIVEEVALPTMYANKYNDTISKEDYTIIDTDIEMVEEGIRLGDINTNNSIGFERVEEGIKLGDINNDTNIGFERVEEGIRLGEIDNHTIMPTNKTSAENSIATTIDDREDKTPASFKKLVKSIKKS